MRVDLGAMKRRVTGTATRLTVFDAILLGVACIFVYWAETAAWLGLRVIHPRLQRKQ